MSGSSSAVAMPKPSKVDASRLRLFSVPRRSSSSSGSVPPPASRCTSSDPKKEALKGRPANSPGFSREASKASSALSKRSMSSEDARRIIREKMQRQPDIAVGRGGNINIESVTPEYVTEFWAAKRMEAEAFRKKRMEQQRMVAASAGGGVMDSATLAKVPANTSEPSVSHHRAPLRAVPRAVAAPATVAAATTNSVPPPPHAGPRQSGTAKAENRQPSPGAAASDRGAAAAGPGRRRDSQPTSASSPNHGAKSADTIAASVASRASRLAATAAAPRSSSATSRPQPLRGRRASPPLLQSSSGRAPSSGSAPQHAVRKVIVGVAAAKHSTANRSTANRLGRSASPVGKPTHVDPCAASLSSSPKVTVDVAVGPDGAEGAAFDVDRPHAAAAASE